MLEVFLINSGDFILLFVCGKQSRLFHLTKVAHKLKYIETIVLWAWQSHTRSDSPSKIHMS